MTLFQLVSSSLLAGLCLTPAAAQDSVAPEPSEIRAERALISVDRKSAGRSRIGLYLREPDGAMNRIWDGEPYDARSLFDRTILVTERWKGKVAWIDRTGQVLFEKAGFDRPVDVELAQDGTIVVVDNGRDEIVGIDCESGAVRWRRRGFREPFDVELLEGGGLLVADSGAGRVVELDASGKVLKEIRGLGFPNTVERLAEGGVLVSNWTGGDVIELDAEGRVVWRVHVGGTIYSAERRYDGLTLVCDGSGGRLVFVNPSGIVLKTERFSPDCVDYETIEEL